MEASIYLYIFFTQQLGLYFFYLIFVFGYIFILFPKRFSALIKFLQGLIHNLKNILIWEHLEQP